MAAEMKLKFLHERNTILGEKNSSSTLVATNASARSAKLRRKPKEQAIKKLFYNVCVSDTKCRRNFSYAAKHILTLAKQLECQEFEAKIGVKLEPGHRTVNLDDLENIRVKTSGEFMKIDTIRRELEKLEDSGQLLPPN